MTGRVFGTICLRLDYDAGRGSIYRPMCQNATKQVHGDFTGVPIIEFGLQSSQNIFGDYCSPVRSEIRWESVSRSRPASERIEDLSNGLT